jgi:hypothetical protein
MTTQRRSDLKATPAETQHATPWGSFGGPCVYRELHPH